jgi:CHAT domain-containing protein/tetratricopeptide (TPR) repeat protein
MRRVLVAAILLAGCNRKDFERLDRLYGAAQADLRAAEISRAERSAEHGLTLARERRDLLFEWRFRLLRAEALLFNRRPEPVLADLSERMPDAPDFAPLAARKLMLEGRATAQLQTRTEGWPILERAHRAAEAAGSEGVLAEIESLQGSWLISGRAFKESEPILRSAVGRAHAVGAREFEASAVLNLGMIRLLQARYDEAVPYFEQASRLVGPEVAVYWGARQNLAACYIHLGEFDQAIRIHREAIARYERSGAKTLLQASLGELGRALLLRAEMRKGDVREAIPYLERALATSAEVGATQNGAVWASNLATVYIDLEEWDKAEASNRESIRLRTEAKIPLLYFNEFNAGKIAAGRGDTAEAARRFAIAMKDGKNDPLVQWEVEEQLGRLAQRDRGPAEAARHFEAAVAIIEKTRSGFERTDLKLPFLDPIMGLYRRYADTLLEQGQVERALAVADSSRAQVLRGRVGSDPVRRLPPGAFREFARKTNSVLLSYWMSPLHSHVWVVTAAQVSHIELPPAGQIEPLVAAYQEAVERQLADPARTGLPAGESLFRMLIEPALKWIPSGSNVVISADGALHGLNFESLPIPGTGRYWIQDVTVSMAPALALLGSAPRAPAQKRLLLLGDPEGADPSYPPLAYASHEMAEVKRRFGEKETIAISRAQATPEAYAKVNPGSFSAIHFTAHATANRESPLDSAVLLAGGKLYAHDVMVAPLNADLVTVSACRGVGVRLYSGEGLVGFAWAFLHAGARNVIAGLWDVNDQSTSTLMDTLYRELRTGKSPGAALHAAKLALLQSQGNFRKPYYWAPFQLYTVAP